MTQPFKGDETELKLSGAAREVFAALVDDLRAWCAGTYEGRGLGALLYDDNLTEIAGKISRDVFIKNYGTILAQWEYPGCFESYLYVLRSVFGPEVEVSFTRLAPGALGIEVVAYRNQMYRWLAQRGQTDYSVTDKSGAKLCFLLPIATLSAGQVMAVLETLIPAGIFVDLTLKLKD